MLTNKTLKEEYKKKRKTIEERLRSFRKPLPKKEMFLGLCFCLCTPQSNALRVASVINKDNLSILLSADEGTLASLLRTKTRFHNNKARYILGARKFSEEIAALPKETHAAREFLVKNIKGLGYKEASHFLRNIGYRDLCIIDRHVINLMHELSIFKDKKHPASPKKYLEMEQNIKEFAKSIKIDVDHLDLLLWSIKTGFVFR